MRRVKDPANNDSVQLHAAIWEVVAKRVPRIGTFRREAVSTNLGMDGLGLDSVQALEVLITLEDRFGVRITPEWIEDHALTIASLADLVRSETSEAR